MNANLYGLNENVEREEHSHTHIPLISNGENFLHFVCEYIYSLKRNYAALKWKCFFWGQDPNLFHSKNVKLYIRIC